MKVLFVRFSSLGDCILTTGVMKLFKENCPEANVGVLTSTDFAEVYDGLDFIDNVHQFDRKKGASELVSFAKKNLNDYTHIIDLHSSLRSKLLKMALKGKYTKYKKQSKERRKFVKTKRDDLGLTKHVTEKYAAALNKAFDIEYKNMEEIRPVLYTKNKTEEHTVVLHPYASKRTKEWNGFPELAKMLLADGYKVIVAGFGNFPIIEGVIDMSNKTDLRGLFEVIAGAEYVVTTDSGPMHAAIAMGKKTIGIFGSTTREFGFFPVFNGCTVVENKDVECRPCDVHGLNECPYEHFLCMKSISPVTVFEALKEL